MNLSNSVVKRLMLARFFLNLATEHARSHREVSSFAAINQLQDAVETFLFAAAEHLNVKLERRTEFNQYLDKIDEKIAPQNLPFRVPLIRLNKARVASKHDAIKPDDNEIASFLVVVREFFDESARIIFSVEFSSINLLAQIDDGAARDLLSEAESAFHNHEYTECLILCRKAFYLTFESEYDVSQFKDDNVGTLAGFGCRAPYFAQSKDYIEKYVKDPFDFIVLDHSKVESNLTRDGIDTVCFWNVWRLTPDVYRQKDGSWLVKREFKKLQNDELEQNASYVLEHTIDMVLRQQQKRKAALWVRGTGPFAVPLRRPGVSVYEKADRASAVVGVIPPEIDQVEVTCSVPGLNGDGEYWQIGHIQVGLWLYGYIHNDDVDLDRELRREET